METHVRDLLPAFMDDALSETDRKKVEAHLALCPDCRRELEELEAVQAEISRFYHSVEVPGIQFEKAVLAKIMPQEKLTMHYRVFAWFFAVCCAASVLCAYPVMRKPFYVGMNIFQALCNILSSGFHIALSILSALPALSAGIMVVMAVIFAVCIWILFGLLTMKPVKE